MVIILGGTKMRDKNLHIVILLFSPGISHVVYRRQCVVEQNQNNKKKKISPTYNLLHLTFFPRLAQLDCHQSRPISTEVELCACASVTSVRSPRDYFLYYFIFKLFFISSHCVGKIICSVGSSSYKLSCIR